MFLRKAAIQKVPAYAVVDEHAVEAVEEALEGTDEGLQAALDAGYAELDRRQVVLSEWLAEQVSAHEDELSQSLGYFLAISVYLSFREAFPRRLGEVTEDSLAFAQQVLSFDEELRRNDPYEVLESDDVIAMGQPILIEFVQHHLREALDQAGDDADVESLQRIYRAILVEIMCLGSAVRAPDGAELRNFVS